MWEQQRSNRRRTVLLVALMAFLLVVTGYFLVEIAAPGAGILGVPLAVGLWFFIFVITWFQGDNIVLTLSGAKRIERDDHPILFNVVEEMCIASGTARMPAIYIIDEAAPNAFAVGRSKEHACVAVTAGLLERLTRDELQGVIAHELAHIRNRDVSYMVILGVMMGTIVILADIGRRGIFHSGSSRRRTSSSRGGGEAQLVLLVVGLLFLILAPVLAELLYFAVSRKREYLADACSAQYTRFPQGLASALEKISRSPVELAAANRATAPMYIVNPMKLSGQGLADLSSTHPPTSERIRILRAMGGGGSYAEYDTAFRKVTGRAVGVVPASALATASQAAASQATAPAKTEPKVDTRSSAERMRQVTDVLWRLNQFSMIACACGTKLKLPPSFVGRSIACPHCGAAHTSGASRPAA